MAHIFNVNLPLDKAEGSGVDTSNDTVTTDAMREGYTAHDADGSEITGTIPDYSGGNTVEMTSPDGATLNTAGTYCEGDIEVVPKLQEKTATTGEIVTADEGFAGLKSVDTTGVFEAGKKSEYDAFWDAYQQSGRAEIDYSFAFAGGRWDETTFIPKYDITPYTAANIFYFSGMKIDLAEHLDKCGVKLDFSKASTTSMAFAFSKFTRIGAIVLKEGTSCQYLFNQCGLLVTLDKLTISENNDVIGMFNYCDDLANLTIEGTIGKNDFNVSWSPLTHDSLMSIINALQDKTADTSGTAWVVTIGEANRAKLTAEELYIAEAKGWEVK